MWTLPLDMVLKQQSPIKAYGLASRNSPTYTHIHTHAYTHPHTHAAFSGTSNVSNNSCQVCCLQQKMERIREMEMVIQRCYKNWSAACFDRVKTHSNGLNAPWNLFSAPTPCLWHSEMQTKIYCIVPEFQHTLIHSHTPFRLRPACLASYI